ncbi:aldehyde ferredoxin oxidoreductase family protein [Fervidicoccus fontis]|uniref:Aldehyde ferredoxin oxidoreductase family protein n=1 Tax=Fervidicoccus fontis TaxID=683846 RepID=A0A843AHA4_9CREN|nr:aldehyde ferredoxin oxidoreductase family protein [Fervidicoccus fontis]MBE9390969.1 aldehyde ferredoxin oxidoreductase family protein [Fervidicoccus fontis]
MIGGFHGKILKVDLSTGTIKTLELSEEMAKSFVGGSGLAAALLYDILTRDLDPLSPDSPLLFITGPFTGSKVPSSSRYAICAKSPLTGLWGESTAGGHFPASLKLSGYDGILFVGRSSKPVYLFVHNGEAEIKDASDLWGLTTYETQEAIRDELGRDVKVASIGPAGENMVKFAAVINDEGKAAGRTGMGAVMGSKNLKAVAVYGNMEPPIADPKTFSELLPKAIAEIESNPTTHMSRLYGTLDYVAAGMSYGDVPTKYYQDSIFPAYKLNGKALREKYYVKPIACTGCPIACGKEIEFGKYGLEKADTLEYETAAAFGPLCGIDDLDALIYINYLCNAYGMDTISAGASVAFAMNAYEKGKLTKEKLGGLEAKWGDKDVAIELVHMIANRKSIGGILAEGTKVAASKLGIEDGEVAVVKGLEIPMHDPRAFSMQALTYATSTRGACHMRPDYFTVEIGQEIPELGIRQTDRFASNPEKVESFIKFQNVREVYDSLILCKFSANSLTTISKFYSAITGVKVEPKEFNVLGERIYNIKRSINLRLGMRKEDEKLPKIILRSIKRGGTQGNVPNIEEMLRHYYAMRKIDPVTGKPMKEKLEELGLLKQAKDLWG